MNDLAQPPTATPDLAQPPTATPDLAQPPTGELTITGRLVRASNATFLTIDEANRRWVYKPLRGEAPLWDFPAGTLGCREIAAHDWSQAAGFDCVPYTCRAQGPLGVGSVQHWVHDAEDDLADVVALEQIPSDWFAIAVGLDADDDEVALVHADHPGLRRLALFDVITNNADRKAGHVLHRPDTDQVWGVDHGLTFNVDPKLRTILWGWAGEPLTSSEHHLLHRSLATLEAAGAAWLSDEELAATDDRVRHLLATGTFPEPADEGWRAIPWPPW